ncbi:MAG: fibronectin type III domain-containing protein [Deltaproteobacteria bacterium]|nr:fibronectin type III domain-containing protein [Deltaproteobacteria bacterium]
MLRIKSLSQYNSSQFTFFHPSLLKTLLLSALAFLLFLFIFSQDIFASQIRLAWDPNTESDLAGYKVYYGTTSGTYGTPIDAGNVTTYTMTGLTLGQTYFITVTAYDTSPNESGYSNEVSGPATDGTQTFTVTTNPSGLQVVVDGTTYTAPQTFSWVVGSSHTLSVSSPQSGTTGTQYAFSSWSDEGAQSHTIIAPSSSTTYTANFTTQYSLTTSVSPSGNGTVTPSGTNWYNSGQSVPVSATASSGYNFTAWSGDLSGSTNPSSITMNGPKEVTAQFAAISETISTPAMPTGTTSGNLETSYTYIASGASSNLGHSLEYQFDWKGDGTDLSLWGAANQQEVWTIAGTYNVRVRARCSTHTSVVSSWSSSLQVTIQGVYQISCSDSGIQCLERTDGGSDSNNLVNGKPKVDVEYDFQITVQDAGGTPQYVKLFTTQRNNPAAGDFYDYDMTCSGNYPTGASCTHRTMLGPAAVHKFYFQVKMSNGSEITYPSTGYITGPEIQLLNGNNLVGVPRNIASAQLDGQGAFGTPRVYRWNAEQNSYTKVSSSQPVKEGEGYSLYKQNKSVPELSAYTEVPDLEYTYSLKPGLNLVSNPYSGRVRLSDIKIQKGTGTPVPWQEAVARGWIVDALYYYNGKDWGNTYSYLTSEDGGVLVPWLGYWVDLEATDDLYYLVVPKP